MAAALAPRLPRTSASSGRIFSNSTSADAGGERTCASRATFPTTCPRLSSSQLLRARRDGARLVDATLMVQREVADRIEGKPGSKDYGTLAIFVGAARRRAPSPELPPGAFRPMPKVHSAVLRPASSAIRRSAWPTRLSSSGWCARSSPSAERPCANALKPFAEERGADARAALAARRARRHAATGGSCNLQNWRGLRTSLLLDCDELCYSLHEFSLSLSACPSRRAGGVRDAWRPAAQYLTATPSRVRLLEGRRAL